MKTVLFAGVALVLATSAFAQSKAAVTSSGSEDIEFVLDAAKGGMAEVELGKLAAERAKNDEVKKFAQRMVDDHTKAGDQLKSIAESKGIKLPTEMEAKDRALMNRLQKLNGAAFDRAYMQSMVADHEKDVAKFREEAKSSPDPDVKDFASRTLPTLESHLQMARDISGEMKHTTSGARR